MTINGDEIVFTTGKRVYANRGALSLRLNEDGFAVGYGSDGGYSDKEFSPAEKREMADYMCSLWMQWAAGSK
jgi:hypothetical protein